MALPRNGCIIKTTYLGYLDKEPTATCSAISHIAASIHEGLLKAPAQRPAPRMPGSISSQAAIGLGNPSQACVSRHRCACLRPQREVQHQQHQPQHETYSAPPDVVRSRHQRQPPCLLATLAADNMGPSKIRCTPKAKTAPTRRLCSSLDSPPASSRPPRWGTFQERTPPSRPAPVDGESRRRGRCRPACTLRPRTACLLA